MPITHESLQNFLTNYDIAIERQEKEWRQDAENLEREPSEWTATKCFNRDGGNDEHFRSVDFYMFQSDAVLDVLLSAKIFSVTSCELIRGWMKSGKLKNDKVAELLRSKLKSNRFARIKKKITNPEEKSPKTIKDEYHIDALAAYVEEYLSRNLTFYGHYYTPPLNQQVPNFFKLDLDVLFKDARLTGIADEFPKLAYSGKIEYRYGEVYVNFIKDTAPNYPNLNLSLISAKKQLGKKALLNGMMEMSIPTADKRVRAEILLYTAEQIAAPIDPLTQLEPLQILRKLFLSRNRFQTLNSVSSTSAEQLETAGFPIDFLEDLVGTYFGYQRTDQDELEVFIFRLHDYYYGILEHSNLLKASKRYYCTITPISKLYQRIEVNVLHANNRDPLLRLYINVGGEKDFEREKIYMTRLTTEYPKQADIILQKLSSNPREEKAYIKAEVLNIKELTHFQDQEALVKLLPSESK